MTNFNELPLEEKLEQAQKGDVVVTDAGARLNFIKMDGCLFELQVSSAETSLVFGKEITDIIRPSEKQESPEIVDDRPSKKHELPEIVEKLRDLLFTPLPEPHRLAMLIDVLADHFEKESRK